MFWAARALHWCAQRGYDLFQQDACWIPWWCLMHDGSSLCRMSGARPAWSPTPPKLLPQRSHRPPPFLNPSGHIELRRIGPHWAQQMQSAHSCSIPAHWHSGWLAGWLMLHKETRFKFSRYLFIFKMIRLISITGWLASWLGWLAGRCGLAGWLAVCGLAGLADWLWLAGWLAGWLAVAAWLVG